MKRKHGLWFWDIEPTCLHCDSPVFARKVCCKHYQNLHKFGDALYSKRKENEQIKKERFTRQCLTCKKEFIAFVKKCRTKSTRIQKYCSRDCLYPSKLKPKLVCVCDWCGEEFAPKDQRNKNVYCSVDHARRAIMSTLNNDHSFNQRKIERTKRMWQDPAFIKKMEGVREAASTNNMVARKCDHCGDEFKAPYYYKKIYCSKLCNYRAAEIRWQSRQSPAKLKGLSCEWCEKEFESSRKKRFCCLKCSVDSWQSRNPNHAQEYRKENQEKARLNVQKGRQKRRQRFQYLSTLVLAVQSLGLLPPRPKLNKTMMTHQQQKVWRQEYLLVVEQAAKQVGLI
jgi:hypothetical protein